MKNTDEELIQQLIEDQLKGIKPIDCLQENLEDVVVYQLLFRELSNETHVADDFNIAEKVAGQISSNQYKAELIKYAAVILTICITFILLTGLSIMFVDPGIIAKVVKIVTTHNKVFLFILLIITAVQTLDKVLVINRRRSIV